MKEQHLTLQPQHSVHGVICNERLPYLSAIDQRLVVVHSDLRLGRILRGRNGPPAISADGPLHIASVGKQTSAEGVRIERLRIVEHHGRQRCLIMNANGAGHLRRSFGRRFVVGALRIDLLKSTQKQFVLAIEDQAARRKAISTPADSGQNPPATLRQDVWRPQPPRVRHPDDGGQSRGLRYITHHVMAATVTWKALSTSFSSMTRMVGFW